jgi:hypothetical protein
MEAGVRNVFAATVEGRLLSHDARPPRAGEYRLKDGSTIRVSADPQGDYMFPPGETTPK